MLLSRKEKEKLVIKLAEEGKTTREIAKIVHLSLVDIGKIIRKATGDEDPSQEEKQKQEAEKEKQKRKPQSPYAQSFQMFKDKKPLADVSIELDKNTDVVLSFYGDYLRLTRMDGLVKIYNELKDDFPLFFHLYRRIKKEGFKRDAITDLLENQNKLTDLNKEVNFYNNHIYTLQFKKSNLEQEINKLGSKRDNYDGITSL